MGQNLPDDQFGNTWKTIDVQVLAPITATPVLTAATSPAVGQARLNWTFNPGATTPFVGFQVYATTTRKTCRATGWSAPSASPSAASPSPASPPARPICSTCAPTATARPASSPTSWSFTIARYRLKCSSSSRSTTPVSPGRQLPEGNNTTCTSNIYAPQDCHQAGTPPTAIHRRPRRLQLHQLDASGNSLLASAATWSCVRDNVTGLVWEGKTDDGTIHDQDNTYRWGGKITALGTGAMAPTTRTGIPCVDGSNSSGSAATDRRVPTRTELQGLVHYGRRTRAIDTDYLPNRPASYFWSARRAAVLRAAPGL